jgi:TolB protein
MLALAIATSIALAPESKFLTSVRDSYPAPSPDGKALLFQSNRGGRAALWLADADGGHARVLLDSGDDPSTPTWSPDGTRIAYVATVAGSTEIFVVDADGTNRRQLTAAPGDDEHPHWGGDGRIWFDSGRTTPDLSKPWSEHWQEVHSMAADGSDLRQHTQCRALCTFASLAPDGERIAYRRVLPRAGLAWDQSAAPRDSEVMVANRDGSDERNVSSHPAFDGWPVWSPDSRWIAFASNRGGVPNVGQVYAVRPDGTALHPLTGGTWGNVQPAFSPDGTLLFTYRFVETAEFEHGFVAVTPVADNDPPPDAGANGR